jgi:SAM-dependent methyltransferase
MNLETLDACPLCGRGNILTIDLAANICLCEPCGYVFDNPRPTVEELVRFYSQPAKYDSWLGEESARDQLWARRLKLLLPAMKPGSVLDVGAGIGQFLHLARPHFSSVHGTEVSESAIEIARKKYGLDLRQGEIQAVDFGEQQFDNVTLFHVLEHVPNPRLVVQRCAELLAPGGILVIAVPNDVLSLRSRVRRLRASLGFRSGKNGGRLGLPKLVLDGSLAEIHLSHFTPDSLQNLVERCGFSVIANVLDPYYVATGRENWKRGGFYEVGRAVHAVLKTNIYDTILVIAQKPEQQASNTRRPSSWRPGSKRRVDQPYLSELSHPIWAL